MKNSEYILYLDMDGVLVDYSSGWWDIANRVGLRTLQHKDEEYSKEELEKVYRHTNTPEFWSNLKWEHGGQEVWKAALTLFDNIHILSSTAAKENVEKGKIVQAGKLLWIKDNLPQLDPKNIHIVSEGVKKAEFANPISILVDDRKSTIKAFIDANGYGILHKASQYRRTVEELRDIATPLNLGEIARSLPIVKRGFWNRK